MMFTKIRNLLKWGGGGIGIRFHFILNAEILKFMPNGIVFNIVVQYITELYYFNDFTYHKLCISQQDWFNTWLLHGVICKAHRGEV